MGLIAHIMMYDRIEVKHILEDCNAHRYQARTNLRQNSFTFRVVNAWNSLPDCVVTAPSLNSFKNRLDRAWKDHPWKLNFELELGNYYTSKLRTPQINKQM